MFLTFEARLRIIINEGLGKRLKRKPNIVERFKMKKINILLVLLAIVAWSIGFYFDSIYKAGFESDVCADTVYIEHMVFTEGLEIVGELK